MKIPVNYGEGIVREVDAEHTLVNVDGKVKEVYRSKIHTNPVTKKRCYVEFDPEVGEVKIVEVK